MDHCSGKREEDTLRPLPTPIEWALNWQLASLCSAVVRHHSMPVMCGLAIDYSSFDAIDRLLATPDSLLIATWSDHFDHLVRSRPMLAGYYQYTGR